jgi:glycosyltransferase involved in cell wall biosynthesis
MGKILIIASVFPPDAVTSAYLNIDLANALAKDGEVTVIRPFPSRPKGVTYTDKDIKQYDNFETVLVDSYRCPSSKVLGRFRESISFGRACQKYIEEHHDEIGFIYNHSWHLFGYNMVAKTAVRFGIPYMTVVQDIYPESLFTSRHLPPFIQKLIMKTLGRLDIYTLRNAARVRTISEEMRAYLIKTRGLDATKVFAVDNWQDDSNYLYKPKDGKYNPFVFEYLGSINSHSNVELIIRAFAKAQLFDAELRIYGGGNKKDECVQLVKDLGLNNVRFDYVQRDDVPQVQAEASVLMLALSKGNGAFSLPSKVTSYMLSGRPILASVDVESATTRYINKAKCGVAVPPADEEALARAIKMLYSMPSEELAEMGANSRKFAETHLTREYNLNIVTNHIKDFF